MSSAGALLHKSVATKPRYCMFASRSAPSAYGDELYRKLNAHQDALAAQGVAYYERRPQIKEQKAAIDAELEQRWQRVWRAYSKSSKEREKQERYAHEQCDLLRALEDLAAAERTMYETSQWQRSRYDGL
jgi:hypothetical protein